MTYALYLVCLICDAFFWCSTMFWYVSDLFLKIKSNIYTKWRGIITPERNSLRSVVLLGFVYNLEFNKINAAIPKSEPKIILISSRDANNPRKREWKRRKKIPIAAFGKNLGPRHHLSVSLVIKLKLLWSEVVHDERGTTVYIKSDPFELRPLAWWVRLEK